METLYLDTETFSECSLKTHGLHPYAEHPTTEITVVQWAWGDDAPHVADCTERCYNAVIDRLQGTLKNIASGQRDAVIVAHNSPFDRTMIAQKWGVKVPVKYWRDTMAKDLAQGLPG